MKGSNHQVHDTTPTPESGQVDTPKTGRLEIRSSLLKLDQGSVVLRHNGDQFAVIERFGDSSPYAQANGPAQLLWEGNHPPSLAAAFREDAKLTLEFMASNLTAKAQKIVWERFPDHRPGHILAGISECCRQTVAEEETIQQSQTARHGMRI